MAESAYSFREPEGLLAHYTKAATAFEHIVPSGKLRMSPYSEMRDPAENKDVLPATGYWPGETDNETALRAWSETLAIIKQYRDSARLLSFTRDADEPPAQWPRFGCCWARPRMWEQYGDAHYGVCLVFDTERLEKAVAEEIPPFQGDFYFDAVRYLPEGISGGSFTTIPLGGLIEATEIKRRSTVTSLIQANVDDFFFLKSDDFETEHEYRAVALTQLKEGYAFVAHRDSLVAVVLGERFPKWQIPGAREVCAEAGVELRRMVWDKGRPLAARVK